MVQQLPGPQWATDPYGRHERRYWDGAVWTVHVSDHGVQSIDDRTAEEPARTGSTAPSHRRAAGRAWTPLVVAAAVATGLVGVVAGVAALTSSPDPASSATGDRILPLAGRATPTRSRPVVTTTVPSARVSRVASTSPDASSATSPDASSATSPARVTTSRRPPARTSTPAPSSTTRTTTTAKPRTTSPKPTPTKPTPTTSSGPPLKDYKNCTEMHVDYPHGVGRKGAHDTTSGTPVTTFFVSDALYEVNSESDADGDGIACEKR